MAFYIQIYNVVGIPFPTTPLRAIGMQTDAEKQFNMHKLHFCWQLENKTLHAEKLGRVETKSI